jgi:hypothetical protein
MEEIKPLLARIQELKSGRGGALSGTQLIAFFLQRQVQPLQHRLSKLWTFSGLEDPSRVSKNLMEKKDLDRRVRALNTLKKDHEVADLAASHFDSDHPLHAVTLCCLCLPCLSLFIVHVVIVELFLFLGSPTPHFSPSSPRGRGHSTCSYFRDFRSP